jgi:Dolichyl-phosphate-mannose-protein mannosyltransferase
VRSCLARRRLGLGACAVGALLSLAATLPALRLVPIHVDEATTLEYASHRFTSIAHDTFLARGGGPVYFYLEHGTLSWPGGLDGLRLPSVVFLVFALVAAWFFGKELLGAETGAGLVIALAVAPLAVSLGTFARPYTMLLAFLLLAAWLSLRAGAQPSRGRWIAAGVASGLLFSVHPIAPLYSALAFSSGLIVAPGPRRRVVRSALPGIVAFVVASLPYVYALAVLANRYEMGASGGTSAGLGVPRQAFEALTGETGAIGIVLGLAALAGLFLLARDQARVALLLGLWLVAPVLFFTVVPVGATHFFSRYMLFALPAFLLLVVVACLRVAPRGPVRYAGIALLGAVVAWYAHDDVSRISELRSLGMRSLAATVEAAPDEQILFSSTGERRPPVPSPELLDAYVDLSDDGITRAEELPAIDPWYAPNLIARGKSSLSEFLADAEPRVGVWILSGRPERVARTAERIASLPELTTSTIADRFLLVRTKSALPPRQLVEQGMLVRRAWGSHAPGDRLVRTILTVDRLALGEG